MNCPYCHEETHSPAYQVNSRWIWQCEHCQKRAAPQIAMSGDKLRIVAIRACGRAPKSSGGRVVVSASLTHKQAAKYKRLGGSAWLKDVVDNAE